MAEFIPSGAQFEFRYFIKSPLLPGTPLVQSTGNIIEMHGSRRPIAGNVLKDKRSVTRLGFICEIELAIGCALLDQPPRAVERGEGLGIIIGQKWGGLQRDRICAMEQCQ
jgi:hypothetical protein